MFSKFDNDASKCKQNLEMGRFRPTHKEQQELQELATVFQHEPVPGLLWYIFQLTHTNLHVVMLNCSV